MPLASVEQRQFGLKKEVVRGTPETISRQVVSGPERFGVQIRASAFGGHGAYAACRKCLSPCQESRLGRPKSKCLWTPKRSANFWRRSWVR
jgi:hypothetical protein